MIVDYSLFAGLYCTCLLKRPLCVFSSKEDEKMDEKNEPHPSSSSPAPPKPPPPKVCIIVDCGNNSLFLSNKTCRVAPHFPRKRKTKKSFE
jgi:hypothetical protein